MRLGRSKGDSFFYIFLYIRKQTPTTGRTHKKELIYMDVRTATHTPNDKTLKRGYTPGRRFHTQIPSSHHDRIGR